MTRNNSETGSYRVGLFGIDIEVGFYGSEARLLLDILFRDLPPAGSPVLDRRFDVVMVGRPTRMSLWRDEEQYYFGESRYELAHILINEIIFSCITGNTTHQAIHAAALSVDGKGILLPGKSGSGKSSLAAWLALHGAIYLTDELALISESGTIFPFTRPISLKKDSYEALKKYFPLNDDGILESEKGSMLPHRSLNPHWESVPATLDMLVFPTFVQDRPGSLTPISSAKSCMKLMECFVNARNLQDHGFQRLAELTRKVASYELVFGSYESILPALKNTFPTLC